MLLPVLTLAPARRLEPADLNWATALLESACTDHALRRYCCAGPAAAQRAWLLRFGLRFGRAYSNAEGSAVAVWLGPKRPAATLFQLLRARLLPAALWRFGWAGLRRLERVRRSATQLRQQGGVPVRHCYLLALVVSPASRGHRLVQATLAALLTTHAPCYLDSQWPAQLIFSSAWASGSAARAGWLPSPMRPAASTVNTSSPLFPFIQSSFL